MILIVGGKVSVTFCNERIRRYKYEIEAVLILGYVNHQE